MVSAAVLLVILRYLSGIDLQASTTVAVVLPALVAASLIRQGEHAIAGLLLAGVRWCGLIVIVLVFAATAFLAVREPSASASSQAACYPDRATAASSGLLGSLAPTTPAALRLDPPGFDCVVEDMPQRLSVPPEREHAVVLAGAIGTLSIAGLLSLGMAATSWRIRRARRDVPRRDGEPAT